MGDQQTPYLRLNLDSDAERNANWAKLDARLLALARGIFANIPAGGDLQGYYPDPTLSNAIYARLPPVPAVPADVGKALQVGPGGTLIWTTPTVGGPASGDLIGSYPNPQLAHMTVGAVDIGGRGLLASSNVTTLSDNWTTPPLTAYNQALAGYMLILDGGTDVVRIIRRTPGTPSSGSPTLLTLFGDGHLRVTLDPAAPLDVATKQYVDQHIPTSLPPSGPATGSVLSGTYPAPTMAANAVMSANITDLNVIGSKIAPGAVTTDKLSPSPSLPADVGKMVTVGAGGAFAYATPGSGGGIPEAPTDGQLYGRKSSAWSVVPAGGGGISEAPTDGQLYGRQSSAWAVVPAGGSGVWTSASGFLTPTSASDIVSLTGPAFNPTSMLRWRASTGSTVYARLAGSTSDTSYFTVNRNMDVGGATAPDDATKSGWQFRLTAETSAAARKGFGNIFTYDPTTQTGREILYWEGSGAVAAVTGPFVVGRNPTGALPAQLFQVMGDAVLGASTMKSRIFASANALGLCVNAPAMAGGTVDDPTQGSWLLQMTALSGAERVRIFRAPPAASASFAQVLGLSELGRLEVYGAQSSEAADQSSVLFGSRTQKGRLIALPGTEWIGLAANRRYNGTTWVHDTSTIPAWNLNFRTDLDTFSIYRETPPSPGPAVDTQVLLLDQRAGLALQTPSRTTKVHLFPHPTDEGLFCGVNGFYNGSAWVQDDATKSSWFFGASATGDLGFIYRLPPGSGTTVQISGWDNAGNLTINGAIATKASGTTWANPSDIRIKKNIEPYVRGLAAICALQPKTFGFNGLAGSQDGMPGIGLIADDVQPIMPEMVSVTPTKLRPDDDAPVDLLVLDTSALQLALINAVKELASRMSALEAR